MRLALRRQAHSYGDTETLSSMSTAAKGDGARRVPVEVGGRGFCQDPASQFSEASPVRDRKRVVPGRKRIVVMPPLTPVETELELLDARSAVASADRRSYRI